MPLLRNINSLILELVNSPQRHREHREKIESATSVPLLRNINYPITKNFLFICLIIVYCRKKLCELCDNFVSSVVKKLEITNSKREAQNNNFVIK